jgi:hypothetical protein
MKLYEKYFDFNKKEPIYPGERLTQLGGWRETLGKWLNKRKLNDEILMTCLKGCQKFRDKREKIQKISDKKQTDYYAEITHQNLGEKLSSCVRKCNKEYKQRMIEINQKIKLIQGR